MTIALRWCLTSSGPEPELCPLWGRSLLLFAASYKSEAFYAFKMAAGERMHKIFSSCEKPFYSYRCMLALRIFLTCFVERQRDYQCASARAEQLRAYRAGCQAGCEACVQQFAPLEHGTADEHSPSTHRKHTDTHHDKSETATAGDSWKKSILCMANSRMLHIFH